MPTNPRHSGRERAEGSRETIDHELRRANDWRDVTGTSERGTAPGDEAAPGTPGTGEDLCRKCGGTGRIGTSPCRNCHGSGRIVKAIGGA